MSHDAKGYQLGTIVLTDKDFPDFDVFYDQLWNSDLTGWGIDCLVDFILAYSAEKYFDQKK